MLAIALANQQFTQYSQSINALMSRFMLCYALYRSLVVIEFSEKA
jgi:hypothetical protein